MLVASLTKKEAQKKVAKPRYMTKQDLLVKYNDDKALVDDLIKRKVDSNLWMWDPEFPQAEEHRLYLCFDLQVIENLDVTESSIKVEFQAELDKDCEDGRGATGPIISAYWRWRRNRRVHRAPAIQAPPAGDSSASRSLCGWPGGCR